MMRSVLLPSARGLRRATSASDRGHSGRLLSGRLLGSWTGAAVLQQWQVPQLAKRQQSGTSVAWLTTEQLRPANGGSNSGSSGSRSSSTSSSTTSVLNNTTTFLRNLDTGAEVSLCAVQGAHRDWHGAAQGHTHKPSPHIPQTAQPSCHAFPSRYSWWARRM